MPIFEFRCLKCEKFFELLCMKDEDTREMACPHCKAVDFERVMSRTNYAVNGPAKGKMAQQTRTCSSGSCTTWDIPGCS
ncbi:MAG: zinc ribbon domain-containing protein [Desulfatibacillaceae bacterium]|nr:zinc ribbon domain-containing protein [Desulfatibacillaceae bacterium]